MPTYGYRCDDCEHEFERFQKMSDEPVRVCELCGAEVRRVLYPVAVHFKGSGFYTTDYGRKNALAGSNGGNGSAESQSADGRSDRYESSGAGSDGSGAGSDSAKGGSSGKSDPE